MKYDIKQLHVFQFHETTAGTHKSGTSPTPTEMASPGRGSGRDPNSVSAPAAQAACEAVSAVQISSWRERRCSSDCFSVTAGFPDYLQAVQLMPAHRRGICPSSGITANSVYFHELCPIRQSSRNGIKSHYLIKWNKNVRSIYTVKK